MRILELIDSLNIGGAERMAINIAHALNGQGHKIILCATRKGGALEQTIKPEVPFLRLGKKNFFDLFSFLKLLRIIRKNKIEVIHAHSSSVFWGIGTKLFFPKLKIVWHDHYGDSENIAKKDRKVIRFLSKWMDGVIVVNEKLKDWSLDVLKVHPSKIIFLNNFAEDHFINERPEFSYDNDECINIICLANLRPQKDHFTLIKAFAIFKKLNSKGKQVKLRLVGAFPDKNYLSQLKKLIQNLELENDVEMLGAIQKSFPLILEASIAVLSSISEGLPVTLLEYGFAAKPVIVTDVGQCGEVVDYGKGGWLVPPSDPEQFANALLEANTNHDLADKKAQHLFERVKKHYSSKAFAKRFEAFIETL